MERREFSNPGVQISTNFQPILLFTNSFQILVDNEFGNLIVEFQRGTEKSFEG